MLNVEQMKKEMEKEAEGRRVKKEIFTIKEMKAPTYVNAQTNKSFSAI